MKVVAYCTHAPVLTAQCASRCAHRHALIRGGICTCPIQVAWVENGDSVPRSHCNVVVWGPGHGIWALGHIVEPEVVVHGCSQRRVTCMQGVAKPMSCMPSGAEDRHAHSQPRHTEDTRVALRHLDSKPAHTETNLVALAQHRLMEQNLLRTHSTSHNSIRKTSN